MTGPSIDDQRRQAAELGSSAALRQQSTGRQRETLISRGPGRTRASEYQELARRRRELERLEQGVGGTPFSLETGSP